MDFNDIKLYGRKTMSDVLKEIHLKSQNKEEELKELIGGLKPLIITAGDAVILVPLITKYMEASIKNDDNLIKMVSIVQRAISSGNRAENGDVNLSEEEKDQLLENLQQLQIVK